MTHDVDHHSAVVRVVGVQRVEHVARVDLDPGRRRGGHLGRLGRSGHEAEAWDVVVVPAVREPGAVHRRVEVEHDGQVEHDGARCGEPHVVDHDGTGHVDGHAAHELTGAVDHVVPEVGLDEVVGHDVHLTGDRVELRVGGGAGRQRTTEVPTAQRVELGAELVGQRQLVDGPDVPGVVHDVRVAGPAELAAARGRRHLGQPLARRDVGRADPAVAVPAGLAAVQLDAVHHARAEEPVVARTGILCRVRARAQVPTGEHLGDRADHFEVGDGDLVGNRGEVAL